MERKQFEYQTPALQLYLQQKTNSKENNASFCLHNLLTTANSNSTKELQQYTTSVRDYTKALPSHLCSEKTEQNQSLLNVKTIHPSQGKSKQTKMLATKF